METADKGGGAGSDSEVISELSSIQATSNEEWRGVKKNTAFHNYPTSYQ